MAEGVSERPTALHGRGKITLLRLAVAALGAVGSTLLLAAAAPAEPSTATWLLAAGATLPFVLLVASARPWRPLASAPPGTWSSFGGRARGRALCYAVAWGLLTLVVVAQFNIGDWAIGWTQTARLTGSSHPVLFGFAFATFAYFEATAIAGEQAFASDEAIALAVGGRIIETIPWEEVARIKATDGAPWSFYDPEIMLMSRSGRTLRFGASAMGDSAYRLARGLIVTTANKRGGIEVDTSGG